MGLLLLIIPSVLSLSTDTSSWCFSRRRLPVFDNKIEPAAVVPTAAQGEHRAGCAVLVLTIKAKFPLQTPDTIFSKAVIKAGVEKSTRKLSFFRLGKLNSANHKTINVFPNFLSVTHAQSVRLLCALVCKK